MILLAALLIRIGSLVAFPLIDPTEGRYAEIPREMARSGDWIVPRLEPDRPFWAKPPLAFWATALSYRALGVSEFSARLPPLLFSLATLGLTVLLATRLFGGPTGPLTALILGTTGLFYVESGLVGIDPELTATLTLAATAFVLAVRSPLGGRRTGWGLTFFAGLGLSVLAKGPLGPVLLGMAVLAWALSAPERRAAVSTLPWRSGVALAAGIAVPWHLLAERQTPGFLEYYIVGEHYLRFVSSSWDSLYGHAHRRAFGSIWPYFLAAASPWVPLTAWLAWRRRAEVRELGASTVLFLVCWMMAPLVFFTFSRSLLITYALPSLPPFALLTARLLQSEWESGRLRRTSLVLASVSPLVFLLVAVGVMPLVAQHRSQKALASAFLRDAAGQPPDVITNLIYLDDAPSADFYTDGRVREIPLSSSEVLLGELTDADLDYFAVEDEERAKVPAELWRTTRSVGHFGDFELRRESRLPQPTRRTSS